MPEIILLNLLKRNMGKILLDSSILRIVEDKITESSSRYKIY